MVARKTTVTKVAICHILLEGIRIYPHNTNVFTALSWQRHKRFYIALSWQGFKLELPNWHAYMAFELNTK